MNYNNQNELRIKSDNHYLEDSVLWYVFPFYEELEKVKLLIENQGHSGMSFGLVCSMVNSFCDRGTEFTSYVK